MVGVLESNGNRQPATPSARVPLSVFSQSSSLMSDRAAQAMEKALRNLAMPQRCVPRFTISLIGLLRFIFPFSFLFYPLFTVIRVVIVDQVVFIDLEPCRTPWR